MFTNPEIVRSENLSVRAYVTFYFHNNRIREYNGNRIGKPIHPNRARTIEERDKLLRKLRLELLTALENNCYGTNQIVRKPKPDKPKFTPITKVVLKQALDKKLSAKLSKKYKRNLQTAYDQLVGFLTVEELEQDITELSTLRVEKFLEGFCSTNTYYMNKRRDLSVLFSTISKQIRLPLTSVKETEKRKIKASLHKIYEKDQMQQILSYLKINHYNLYLCCLLTYGTLLRPHEEVRLLCRHHFHNEFTEIHLSGEENKGGRVRIVHVPEYIRSELLTRCTDLNANVNIFSFTSRPFNEYYFNSAWTKVWQKAEEKLIEEHHTIYSFRHTAAIDIYKKSKDLYIVQQLLGHSDMIVTLKYLRGLGEFNALQHKEYMPTL